MSYLVHSIIHLVVFALAVLGAAKLVPGVRVKSFSGALTFAIVFAVSFLVGVNLWAGRSERRRAARERLARENPAALRSMELEASARLMIGSSANPV